MLLADMGAVHAVKECRLIAPLKVAIRIVSLKEAIR